MHGGRLKNSALFLTRKSEKAVANEKKVVKQRSRIQIAKKVGFFRTFMIQWGLISIFGPKSSFFFEDTRSRI